MDTITIICAVAAEFTHPKDRNMKYEITRREINALLKAPAWIKESRNFQLLAQDGTLKYVTAANKLQMENDPTFGLNADGKQIASPTVAETAETISDDATEPKKRGGRKPRTETIEAEG